MLVTKNDEALYAAFKAKDARFDGRFFVGVSTTGIYCRPVCKAKQPKIENCSFYDTAAEAEQDGYRPCLLCRPELAPGKSITDAKEDLALRASRKLEELCASGLSMDEIAGRLGYTSRHLRRVFMEAYHIPPLQYLQTCRLSLAKSLLTDTDLSVLDIAIASGFGSANRFDELFKKRYRLSPASLRKGVRGSMPFITLALGYRPPYCWEPMVRFLSARAIPGIEEVKDGTYSRAVRIAESGKTSIGWVKVSQISEKNSLLVHLSESLLPVLPQVLARIKRLFDLHCDPYAVYETLEAMNEIRPGLCTLGTRVPGCFDAFEMGVRAVLGQQISVKAAGTLASRITQAYGTPVDTGVNSLNRVFLTPEEVVEMGSSIKSRFGELGVTSARSETILELAKAFQNGIGFESSRPEEEIKKLMAIKGIGSWTANYIAMRAMGSTDAFLETDAGVKRALGLEPAEIAKMAEAWRPWRSYAAVNLWNTL
ncbi:MAG: helix-turn-helix domain-containing protein [Clostridiales bacterium]|nr:helix-turn-helix domain-containing protein [Clostridiales bacterium]